MPHIIVVGAGHAGCEAALAAARIGLSVWMYTLNVDTIGLMPCNPSIGGLGKGHLVKEIDALGGEMGRAADASCIQFKTLGTRKGPAVQGTRMQCDRLEYSLAMRKAVEHEACLSVRQEMVDGLLVRNGRCIGVKERSGYEVEAQAVVLATGTFLDGVIHVGSVSYPAGRAGEFPARRLAEQLREFGLPWARFKTGTPPRARGATVDFALMEEDAGDAFVRPFSLRTESVQRQRRSCYRTYTSPRTHELVRLNLLKSPLYSGEITGTPARYCPSLEDKIARFPSRERHPVVVEPEGLHTSEVYLKGLGNSLPPDLQIELVRSVPGLEHAEIVRPAYAIEYDYIDPSCLRMTLETKQITGLYLAGQVNGTSGYEEAAAQGLWAGINAAHAIAGKPPFVLDRSDSYMGVMVDDLITRGVSEPYRMFTSRAEYRLLLREDNAADRLLKKGQALGLIPEDVVRRYEERRMALERMCHTLENAKVRPSAELDLMVSSRGGTKISEAVSGTKFLKRPEMTANDLVELGILPEGIDTELARIVEIEVKYEGYIDRQRREVVRFKQLENTRLPEDFDFDQVPGLSRELRERLKAVRPASLGHASRIPGITPAALTAMMVSLKK